MDSRDRLKELKYNQELQVKAQELHLQGYSYARIGYELGISAANAHDYVVAETNKKRIVEGDCLKEEREKILSRLDYCVELLINSLSTEANDVIDNETGKIFRDGVKAKCSLVDTIRKLDVERSKILGLYSPDRIDQNVNQSLEVNGAVDFSTLSAEELQKAFEAELNK